MRELIDSGLKEALGVDIKGRLGSLLGTKNQLYQKSNKGTNGVTYRW